MTNVSVQVYSNTFTTKAPHTWQRFNPITRNGIDIRNSFLKLNQPSRRTKQGQNCLSYLGPSVWNRLPDSIKDSKNLNNFKHKVKDHFINEKEKRDNNIYVF